MENLVTQAFDTWAKASGLTFEQVSNGTAADIQIGWQNFETSSSNVLGYTSFNAKDGSLQPGVKISLENPEQDPLVSGSAGQQSYSGTDATFYQVVLHEIGHALGLADNSDPDSIMNAVSSSSNRGLDQTDLTGIRELYEQTPGSNNPATPSFPDGRHAHFDTSVNSARAGTRCFRQSKRCSGIRSVN